MTELAAILSALGGLIIAGAVAAVKIWKVVADVNTQLQNIAKEADARRDIAEKRLANLQSHVERLEAEIKDLRECLEKERAEANDRIQALTAENSRLSADNERLQKQVSRLQQELINTLKSEDKPE